MRKRSSAASAQQLAAIRHAIPLLRDGFAFVRSTVEPGITERQLANRLRSFLRSRGARQWSFRFIVAFGSNAAEPHHWATGALYRRGQLVKVDMGITVRGWKTDVTRTFLPAHATLRQRQLYVLVREAQRRAIAAVRAGKTGKEVDAVARGWIARAGLASAFVHSTGHGLGTAIHQPPWLSPKKGNKPLCVGDVVTVEPGVYLEGWGGIRIEDMVLVTASGRRVLSRAIPSDQRSVRLVV